MVFEFEINSAFGSGKDNGDFVFSPGDFIDVSGILLLAESMVKFLLCA